MFLVRNWYVYNNDDRESTQEQSACGAQSLETGLAVRIAGTLRLATRAVCENLSPTNLGSKQI